jgi:hypothetical protein
VKTTSPPQTFDKATEVNKRITPKDRKKRYFFTFYLLRERDSFFSDI